MKNKITILNLLNILSKDNSNISWKIRCLYSNGLDTTINQIELSTNKSNNLMGKLVYQVETGNVSLLSFRSLKKRDSLTITDALTDIIYYFKKN
ncbi:hypothetical protein [Pseudofulvibacter geojedonensis]|uniref:Uncharacterized protein n=1 Tax=Pseudofulvibacter geojedonensis TaxID=1123758 RepID=A0ABW3I6D8_9FLAO